MRSKSIEWVCLALSSVACGSDETTSAANGMDGGRAETGGKAGSTGGAVNGGAGGSTGGAGTGGKAGGAGGQDDGRPAARRSC